VVAGEVKFYILVIFFISFMGVKKPFSISIDSDLIEKIKVKTKSDGYRNPSHFIETIINNFLDGRVKKVKFVNDEHVGSWQV
jgi:metal-responsive CopG/Arc/MetJ family transcriptional regulator